MTLVLPGVKDKLVDGLALVSDNYVGQSHIAMETITFEVVCRQCC